MLPPEGEGARKTEGGSAWSFDSENLRGGEEGRRTREAGWLKIIEKLLSYPGRRWGGMRGSMVYIYNDC